MQKQNLDQNVVSVNIEAEGQHIKGSSVRLAAGHYKQQWKHCKIVVARVGVRNELQLSQNCNFTGRD